MSISCKCPNCGSINELLEKYINSIENENKELKNRIFKNELVSVYFASENRDHFHRPTCEWVQKMNPNNLIIFHSHEEAVDAGYKPCKTCKA